MLSREENELITRVGPGTAMGAAFRRYWLPALLAEELPSPDCPPVRVRLLGEDLVAFRDSAGQLGLLGAHCPHRGASLFFGRNEECGLRCVYHGWKFDVSGQCVDMPSEPAESSFKQKVRTTAYPCVEKGGVIWTYMGPPAEQPPLVDLEWIRAPAGHCHVSKTYEQCNYLQGLEGGVDTAHSSFLHRMMNASTRTDRATERYRARAVAPKLEALTTDYGFTYAGIRSLPDDGTRYVRVYQFVMPFHQMRAYEGYCGRPLVQGHMWMPIDDEQAWIYNWMYVRDGSALTPEEIHAEETETGRSADDLLPGYRPKRNRDNDYLIDREAQRTTSWTGIQGVNTQDIAIQESMGPIYDRTQEHLGSSDLAVITTRRLLLQAARDAAAGREPLGVRGSGHTVRPAEMILPESVPWPEAMKEELLVRW
jgi:phenylpropionate dioxygenase-like ring-hydroxylating dioxygenase large terminal subunit